MTNYLKLVRGLNRLVADTLADYRAVNLKAHTKTLDYVADRLSKPRIRACAQCGGTNEVCIESGLCEDCDNERMQEQANDR
jgi:hypothetical protein